MYLMYLKSEINFYKQNGIQSSLMSTKEILNKYKNSEKQKEEKVKKAFADNPLLEVAAERITKLIIERQIEKIQWRTNYKQQGSK